MTSVTFLTVPDLPLIAPGDDLPAIIIAALEASGLALQNGDIVVIAQKIVSKAEDRYIRLQDVVPGAEAEKLAAEISKDARYVQVVLSESEAVVRTRPNVMIVAHRLGFVMANAGIDQSNIEHADGERVLLLPRDPDRSATRLKASLDHAFNSNVGVIINDSFGRPWRRGVTGVAIGAAGVPSLVNRIGQKDMFGRTLQATEIAIADEIAAGASLIMGQSSERTPVVVVRGFALDEAPSPASSLIRPPETDMFR